MSEGAARISTGISGLDQALGGGIAPGAMVFLVGAAGVGKTIVAQAIGFQRIAAGERVLYFTALSEPHDKLIAHIRDLAFFEERAIGDRMQLLNLQQVLRQGAEETVDAIVQMARANRVGLVVVDGFRSIRDYLPDPLRVREFLYQLSAKLGLLGTICLITFEVEPRDALMHAEMTIADVLIGMWYQPYRVSHTRRIEVLKTRGGNPMTGVHSLVIASDGVSCYPQAEMLPIQPEPGLASARAAFGLPGLDALLGGGLTAGTSTVLAGEMGVGKTLLALTWLVEGAKQGEPGLLLGFQENRVQLIEQCRVFGLDLAPLLERGLLDIWAELPVALDPNRLAAGLRERIAAAGVRRLAIDSERELVQALEPERVTAYLAALVRYLRGEQVTSLFIKEVSEGTWAGRLDFTDTATAPLAENLLLLRRQGPAGRQSHTLAVLKMRFSAFDPNPHAYTLTGSGINVGAMAPNPLGGQGARRRTGAV